MVTETHRRLALELRMAAETLIARPSVDAYNVVSKMLAALNTAGMNCTALDCASTTLSDICDRYERIGKIGLKDSEAQSLRQAMAGIDGQLALIPVNKFAAAVAEVEVFCAIAGA